MGNKIILVAKMAKKLPGHGPFIGIDYGGFLLARERKRMLLAIGDFDSVNVDQLQEIKQASDEVIILPREKDETDTESALFWAKEHGFDEVELWGGMHGRLDHFLANILLVYHSTIPITLVDEKNQMFVLEEGVHTIAKEEYVFLSLLVIQSATISLTGVKYPLDQVEVSPATTFTVSNEIIDVEALLVVHQGKVIVIQAKD